MGEIADWMEAQAFVGEPQSMFNPHKGHVACKTCGYYGEPDSACLWCKGEQVELASLRTRLSEVERERDEARKRVTELEARSGKMEFKSLLSELDFPEGKLFTFYDSPGEHDPCYVVMPSGSMLALNDHATPGVDIARAHFIIGACNEALTKPKEANS